jgi:hypothetical protein
MTVTGGFVHAWTRSRGGLFGKHHQCFGLPIVSSLNNEKVVASSRYRFREETITATWTTTTSANGPNGRQGQRIAPLGKATCTRAAGTSARSAMDLDQSAITARGGDVKSSNVRPRTSSDRTACPHQKKKQSSWNQHARGKKRDGRGGTRVSKDRGSAEQGEKEGASDLLRNRPRKQFSH